METEYKVLIDQHGVQSWYLDGDLRIKVEVEGDKQYFKDGKLHRDDGPAIESINGYKEYFKDGVTHRDDGPAVIWQDGGKQWIVDGKRHRLDGPAVIWAWDEFEWWINDVEMTEEEFNRYNRAKELTLEQVEELLGYPVRIVGIHI